MRVLGGDIGGTKVLLQVAEFERGSTAPRTLCERRFESAEYAGLVEIVREFVRTAGGAGAGIAAACFGVAGPVVSAAGGGSAKVTNLPWVIESTELARVLAVPRVRLINDFQALGYGIEGLASADTVALQTGEDQPRAPRAVIGAGTGLGQGILVWHDDYYEAVATEGGHVDFAPVDDAQLELLRYLRERFGRVSYERILSGPGIVNLYSYICHRRGVSTATDALLDDPDPAAAIADAGLKRSNVAAVEALELFVRVYGAQAGNLALSCLATGGIYVGGGIAPKILPALRGGDFVRAFTDKGRMAAVLAAIPVRVILNPKTGLSGAVLAARRLGRAPRAS